MIAVIAIVSLDLTGCRVITTPVHYLFGSPEPPPAPNTDVTHPGRPLSVASPTPNRRVTSRSSNQRPPSATPKPVTTKTNTAKGSAQFPVAKPVPGKPGLVFSPFKANAYIDVSGYASGSKVKDPDTQKIFVVP